MAEGFWGVRGLPGQPRRYVGVAVEEACVGPPGCQFFMGGVGMAMAVDALERSTGKPLLWATTQFINHGMMGEEFELEVEPVGGGRSVALAGASLRRGGQLLQRTVAALGRRQGGPESQFAAMPDVPAPGDCPPKSDDAFAQPGNLIGQFERRTAREDADAGLEYMWIRPRFDAQLSAPLLALVSDFFLGAHPRTRSGTSLDNTFRLAGALPCGEARAGWILAATQLASFAGGAAHGTQHLFSQDGALLATSSQTGLLPRPSRQEGRQPGPQREYSTESRG